MTLKIVRAVSVLGIIGSLLLASPAQAATPFPGRNGTIAFTEVTQAQTSVGVMNSDGSHMRVVARSAHHPLWSPDGQTLTYVATSGNEERIFVARGFIRRPLTLAQACKQSAPAYSRDGKYIAYVCTKQLGTKTMSAVFVTKTDGLIQRNLTGWRADTLDSPSWSPDGTRIVYQQNQEGKASALFVVHTQTQHIQQVTELSDAVASEVTWSPDGKKILYADSESEAYTIWPDGSRRAVISDGESYHASWSPDGQKIAFLDDAQGSSISIRQPDDNLVQVPLSAGSNQSAKAFSWSPDGSSLAVALEYESGAQKHAGVFTINTDNESSAPVMLTGKTVRDLSWQSR